MKILKVVKIIGKLEFFKLLVSLTKTAGLGSLSLHRLSFFRLFSALSDDKLI